jgi:hypothetical protein
MPDHRAATRLSFTTFVTEAPANTALALAATTLALAATTAALAALAFTAAAAAAAFARCGREPGAHRRRQR